MKGILTRVNNAQVLVKGEIFSSIAKGAVLFIAFEKNDNTGILKNMVKKIVNLRIFEDEQGKLNYSLKDTGLKLLCVPNFTLSANCKKGNRPSFENSLPALLAKDLFDSFIAELSYQGLTVKAGAFGEHMDIKLELDGPVNIIVEDR
ncbi:MAG: D-tyrosyl-tRNA(Tyr) deacylase [Candidatus Omnitrophica bacterium]|jgi:D-tyrosyl-tRNA(Tyr) deacylase|nr:D-tyrosyl-tRNA(Tyr) deacylase [Candidatus Omnitrophota bacterium]